MRLVERVLDGSPVAWACLMLAGIYEQMGCCVDGVGYFFFGSVLV